MSRSKWKGPYMRQKIGKQTILKRSSEITPNMVEKIFWVHNGKSLIKIAISEKMLGFKAGEFVATRSQFVFKKKRRKKNKMGQKANPISLQLGTKKPWTIRFSEKKTRDVGIASEQNTQILKFIKNYLTRQTISLQNFQLCYNENVIIIFLSIFSFTSKNRSNARENAQITLKKKKYFD